MWEFCNYHECSSKASGISDKRGSQIESAEPCKPRALGSCSFTRPGCSGKSKGQGRALAGAVTRVWPDGPSPWGVDGGVMWADCRHSGVWTQRDVKPIQECPACPGAGLEAGDTALAARPQSPGLPQNPRVRWQLIGTGRFLEL